MLMFPGTTLYSILSLLACMQSWHVDKSTFFLQNLINTIESCTGVDLDGDGRNEHVEIPDYDERFGDSVGTGAFAGCFRRKAARTPSTDAPDIWP